MQDPAPASRRSPAASSGGGPRASPETPPGGPGGAVQRGGASGAGGSEGAVQGTGASGAGGSTVVVQGAGASGAGGSTAGVVQGTGASREVNVHVDSKYGRFPLKKRRNVDQVPLPFANGLVSTWADKGSRRVRVLQPSAGLEKRQCTLQLCFGPAEELASFCVSRGSECRYSPRQQKYPRDDAKRSGEGRGRGKAGKTQRQQDTRLTGWKRARLSASPATGLVGMKETELLGSFFDCLGFLPLTNESQVRGAIMRVILASADRADDVDQERAQAPNAEEETEEQQAADAASACMLWCSMAIGALVQGQPPARVAQYTRLARESLSNCFDKVTAEPARAFLMMAYLYNFMRNDDMFHRHLRFARTVLDCLPENTAHREEIADLLERGDSTRIFFTSALEPWELDAYCDDDAPVMEIPGVVHKNALGRVLNQVERRGRKAFLRDHKAQVANGLRKRQASSSGEWTAVNVERLCGSSPGRKVLEKGTGRETPAGGGEEHELLTVTATLRKVSIKSTKMGNEVAASPPGDENLALTKEAREIMALLQDAGEMPEFRMGVGGVLYNGISGYFDVVTGGTSLEAGIEKSKRCAKIFTRYPGLCRFSSWRHMSHFLLSVLAVLPDAKPYEELRKGYNSVRAEDAPEAPPYGEWTMIGLCDHVFCRCIDQLAKKRAGQTARDVGDTGKPVQAGWWHPDQVQQDTHESWASNLGPELSHAQSTAPGGMLPRHEWYNVLFTDDDGGLLKTSESSTLQPLDLEPIVGFPNFRRHQSGEPAGRARSVLSASGLTTAEAPAVGGGSFCPARFAECDKGRNRCCASASSAFVARNDSFIPRTEYCYLESPALTVAGVPPPATSWHPHGATERSV